MRTRAFREVVLFAMALTWVGMALAKVGPPVKVRLLGEPRAAQSGSAVAGQLVIESGTPAVLSGFRFAPSVGLRNATTAPPRVVRLAVPSSVRVAPETPLTIDFEIVVEPSAPVTFAFEFDGETVAKRLDLSAQHVELMTHGGAVVSVAPFDRLAPQAVPSPSAVLRSVRVYGRLVYSRPARCIDTDFDYQVDSCADNLQACSADSGCRSDRIGADNVYVEIKDNRALQADDVLAITQTDEQGYFDASFSEGGTPDIYVRFEAKNGAVEVEDATWERNYSWRTWTSNNFGGTALNFGTVEPTDNAGALNIHNTVTRVARWSAERIAMWAPTVDVQWPSSDSYYNWLFDEIHIHHAQTQWDDETVAHEWGHRWSESFGEPYHSLDYCNGVCDDPLGGVDEFLLGCGHCRWCNEGGLWAWYEGWSAWVADSFLRSYKSRYSVRPLFAPVAGDDLESPPTASDTSNCVEADSTPCECDPDRAEGFVAALLRDIEDENRTFAFGGAITVAGGQVVYDRQLKPKRAVSAAADRIAAVGAVEGTLDPVVSIMQCNTSTACSVVATDNDSGGDEPPGPGSNALIARYLTPDWSPPSSTVLFRVRVQGNGNTIGPFAARLEDLDDHDGDGIADELAVGANLILATVKEFKPVRPQEFLSAFAAMNPGLLEPLWATAWNVGYDIGDVYPPDPPSQLASTSHTVGGRTEFPYVTFTWRRATDDISGVDGYSVRMTAGYASPPPNSGSPDIGNVTTYTTSALSPGVYYFTIRAHDRSGKWSGTYAQLGPIEILPPCNLTVEAPSGGEVWTLGTTHGIAWTCHRNAGTYGAETVKLELLQAGATVRTLGYSLDSSRSWEIPTDVTPGSGYQIRVSSTSWPDDRATSGPFTLGGDLVDNGDGTVTHANACLMWLKNAAQAGTTMTWQAAGAWARDLVFAGRSDWRLPSGRNPDGSVCNSRPAGANCPDTELGTLYFRRMIRWGHSDPFTLGGSSYWTATTYPADGASAMTQDLIDGGQLDTSKSSHAGAWAVRSIPACTPSPGYPAVRYDADGDGFTSPDDCNDANAAVNPLAAEVCGNGIDDNCNGLTDEYCSCGAGLVDHGDGTVTETSTCLMWVKDFAVGFSGSGWADSMTWVGNLVYAGHDDWRLPATQVPDATCDSTDTATGYHCSGSEMGHLYYVTLGNQASVAPGCTGPFLHYGQGWGGRHWSSTSSPTNGSYAYVFHFAGSETYPGQQHTWYKPQDQYGSYGASILPVRLDLECWGDADGDGYRSGTDCDDADPTVHPGADETCDGKDNDCDGAIDEGFTLGLACTSGTGACESAGQTVCAAGGQGTGLVRDILPGSVGSSPYELAAVGQTLFFKADDPATGTELWKSDGTAAGTVLVKDVYPGTASSSPASLTPAGSTLFFVAADASTGGELWKSDGTAAGTVLVKDVNPGTAGSWPSNLRSVGSTLFFVAADGTSGSELWKSDGTTGGTARVKDINPGAPSASPAHLAVMNGILYFEANDGLHGNELWRSDGTDAGTYMVKDIASGGSNPDFPVVLNGVLYFRAYEPATGYELWRSDGTAAGTWIVRDAVAGSDGSAPARLTATPGLVFYLASDGVSGEELWRSDGTAGGTFMVHDINPGPGGCMGIGLTQVGSRVMLLADNGQTGRELWVSDGTQAGTALVRDVLPGLGGNDPYCLLGVGETLYFCASDGVHGIELWTSDGTYGGTALVRDINPQGHSYPQSLAVFRGLVYFAAYEGTNGTELWRSDGTADGTRCGATPGAPSAEVCDGEDNDCDGAADEEALDAPTWHSDADGDTYGAPAGTIAACAAPAGWVANGTDCDDTRAAVNPGLPEIGCDGLDNDCNPATPDVFDADGDGLICGVDCDDSTSSCTTNCADLDGDGVADCAELIADGDNDGIFPPQDCNDADPLISPDATETCNGKDDDCDGQVDEGCDGACDNPEKVAAEVNLAPGAAGAASGRLAWNGNGYGLAWSDQRDGNSEIYFALLDASMNKIGTDLRVTNAPGVSDSPWIVWTGRDYGIAWEDARDGNTRVFFVRIDSAGGKIGTDSAVAATDTATSRTPRLLWDGREFGLFWNDNRDGSWENYFRTIDASGNVLGTPRSVTAPPYASNPCGVVWTGSEYGVTYNDARTGDWEIYVVRLDAAGLPLGPEQRATYLAGTSRSPSIVWRGDGYGLFWIDNHFGYQQIFYARLASDGTKIGSDVPLMRVTGTLPLYSAAWTGSEFGIAWIDTKDGNSEVYFQRIGADGTLVSAEVRVTSDPALTQTPSLQWTGSAFGLAVVDARPGSNAVFGARIACCDDGDGDGFNECHDCNDYQAATYPGAQEVNDGLDNQCAGDPGFGVIDEVSGAAGFTLPGGKNTFCWPPQGWASSYEVARAEDAEFHVGCTTWLADVTCWTETQDPGAGTIFHYLVRAMIPYMGSWGQDSSGAERTIVCP